MGSFRNANGGERAGCVSRRVLPGRMALRKSREIMRIFHEEAPLVEQLASEAFLDVSGMERLSGDVRVLVGASKTH